MRIELALAKRDRAISQLRDLFSSAEHFGLPSVTINDRFHEIAKWLDNAWQEALEAAFGKHAGDMRYTKAGEGDTGSELRRLYDARMVAQKAWHDESEIIEYETR
jgi:hypothetical protein